MTAAASDNLPGSSSRADRYLQLGVAMQSPEGTVLRDMVVHYPRSTVLPGCCHHSLFLALANIATRAI